jgi:hypothetical protein
MSKRNNQGQKHALALAMAAGGSVRSWAKDNQVPARTAYTWSRSEEVLNVVDRIRRRALDRAIGRLALHAIEAAGQITDLAGTAESESVRLQAARAVLAEMVALTDYVGLERRLIEVERRIQAGPPSPSAGAPTARTAARTPGK